MLSSPPKLFSASSPSRLFCNVTCREEALRRAAVPKATEATTGTKPQARDVKGMHGQRALGTAKGEVAQRALHGVRPFGEFPVRGGRDLCSPLRMVVQTVQQCSERASQQRCDERN